MKAIIIEEERFTEVVQMMRARVKEAASFSQHKPQGLTDEQWEHALSQAGQTINYVFVKWAQSHGASCTK